MKKNKSNVLFINQASNHTEFNRYPKVFQELKENAGQINGKVLSFGCSTGEEAMTLGTIYFPDSEVHGLDANGSVLAIAEENLRAQRCSNKGKPNNIKFYGNLEDLSTYDVITCCSVLCRTDKGNPQGSNQPLPPFSFKLYKYTVSQIDRLLNVGGLFCLLGGAYMFEDLHFYNRYEIIKTNFFAKQKIVQKLMPNGDHTRGKYSYEELEKMYPGSFKYPEDPTGPHYQPFLFRKIRN